MALLRTIACLILLAYTNTAAAQSWEGIRDGVLYLRTSKPNAECIISWKNVWISEVQTDHIYTQNPDGSLLKKLVLTKANTPGNAKIILPDSGDYIINITGYNFRSVDVAFNDEIPSVFEPVKVHKSTRLKHLGKLYFNVPANKSFSFNGKNHKGVSGFTLRSLMDDRKFSLQLENKEHHWQFDTLTVAPKDRDTVWELSWSGLGKVSFWLDGIPNFFAKNTEDLFLPQYIPASVSIDVENIVMGEVPQLGATFPFTEPDSRTKTYIQNWGINTANHYTFLDTLTRSPSHDIPFLTAYEVDLNLKNPSIILSQTGRRAVFSDEEKVKTFLGSYFKTRFALGLLNYANFALADEPNLNYPDFISFQEYFVDVATFIKKNINPGFGKIRLAVPESSRFLGGPFLGSDNRKGIDWADKLLTSHGYLIDAISWHEWMVRDLIDTSRYKATVIAASDLAAQHEPNLNKKLDLILTQTNISSGKSLSPYEQDTWFAALWWTSVVIQSSQPGKLDQLVWFKAVDDGIYNKGLLSIRNGQITHKPVSDAMGFISKNRGKWVLQTNGNHPEMDVLATVSEDKDMVYILGVNKYRRMTSLTVNLPVTATLAHMEICREDTSPAEITEGFTVNGKQLSVSIPGESLFAIKLPIKLLP